MKWFDQIQLFFLYIRKLGPSGSGSLNVGVGQRVPLFFDFFLSLLLFNLLVIGAVLFDVAVGASYNVFRLFNLNCTWNNCVLLKC